MPFDILLYDNFGVDAFDFDSSYLRNDYIGLFGYWSNLQLKRKYIVYLDKVSKELKTC